MRQLSARNLPKNTRTPSYDRDAVTIGIVHFGIGNFHRAHQAVYVEDLLERGETEWGIVGVSLRSSAIRDALKPQDYLYTLAVLGEDTEYRVIGAIKDVLVAPQNPQAVIDLLAKPSTQIVSSTITEKGYCLGSGQVNFEHPALKTESLSLAHPITIYGFLAQGIIERYKTSAMAKLTIMCCDNVSEGGKLLKEGVEYLLYQHDTDALAWMQNHVSFISSMVDRVSPGTNDELRRAVLRGTHCKDASPVSAEPFCQWIIEDNFAGERPNFDQVGADFVTDIEPFERMKLRYLNAAHTMTSALGYLGGDVYVHETLRRPEILDFVRKALYQNVLPNAAVPEGYDGAAYIEDVIKRFQNSNLPYANLQVGTDSSQKIQQRWFPTIDLALTNKEEASYFAFFLAAWVNFIHTALDEGVLSDPKEEAFAEVEAMDISERIIAYLLIANAEGFNFFSDSRFILTVNQYAAGIKAKGLRRAMRDFEILA